MQEMGALKERRASLIKAPKISFKEASNLRPWSELEKLWKGALKDAGLGQTCEGFIKDFICCHRSGISGSDNVRKSSNDLSSLLNNSSRPQSDMKVENSKELPRGQQPRFKTFPHGGAEHIGGHLEQCLGNKVRVTLNGIVMFSEVCVTCL